MITLPYLEGWFALLCWQLYYEDVIWFDVMVAYILYTFLLAIVVFGLIKMKRTTLRCGSKLPDLISCFNKQLIFHFFVHMRTCNLLYSIFFFCLYFLKLFFALKDFKILKQQQYEMFLKMVSKNAINYLQVLYKYIRRWIYAI
jgi:hypothetical protein